MERQPADGCDFISTEQRTAADGLESDTLVPINDHNNNNEINFNNNNRKESIGNEDLSKLRCSSLQIEELQKRKNRSRSNNGTSLNGNSPVYPGLAFVSPMYSNALFRFSIIANEIKDLKSNQLKKVRIDCKYELYFRFCQEKLLKENEISF